MCLSLGAGLKPLSNDTHTHTIRLFLKLSKLYKNFFVLQSELNKASRKQKDDTVESLPHSRCMKVTEKGEISSPADLEGPSSNEMKYGKPAYKSWGRNRRIYAHREHSQQRNVQKSLGSGQTARYALWFHCHSYLGVVYLLYMLYFKTSCVYCCQLSCVYCCSCLVYCCHLMCICCTMCVLLFLL